MIDALNKLCKWRMVLAGWHNGTQTIGQPGNKAMRDLMDKYLISRVESSAIGNLLIQKGVCTAQEFTDQVMIEAEFLDKKMEALFPGFRTTEQGVVIEDIALANKTMADLGFPP